MTSILNDIQHQHILKQAELIQIKASEVGFDFPDFKSTYAKLEEELAELNQAIVDNNFVEIEKEFGDCLFALINIGRKLNLSSEHALNLTVDKFRQRFAYIEQQAELKGVSVTDCSLDILDEWWNEAKNKTVIYDENH